MILDSKKIPYEKLDIAASTACKDKMREISGDPKALPPQISNGDTYCGVREPYICLYTNAYYNIQTVY